MENLEPKPSSPDQSAGSSVPLSAASGSIGDGPSAWTPATLVTQAATNGTLRLEATARGACNYAMHCAGLPLLVRIALRNEAAASLDGVEVRVVVACAASDAPIAERAFRTPSIEAGGEFVIERPELLLDARTLVQLDESAHGSVRIEARSVAMDGEALVVATEIPLRVLAYTQWCRFDGLEELLACHIVPNHPAVEAVRDEASDALRNATGDSAQQGYQAGAERALAIARATFLALQRAEVRYSNPPASSEASQKVRTPDQILSHRFATCLDMACLYAACLEQAGLSPVVVVLDAHAVAGVWLDPSMAHNDAAVRDAAAVMSAVEGGSLLLVETTRACMDQSAPFEEALREARIRTLQSLFCCMVDVRRARRSGVRPLPSRIVENGLVTVIHQDATAARETVVVGQRRVRAATAESAPAPHRIRVWQRDLLDLTLRNPLLDLRSSRGHAVRVVMPPQTLADVERALASEQSLSLLAHDELTHIQRERGARLAGELGAELLRRAFLDGFALFVEVEAERLRKQLSALASKARTMEEEGGANILHISFGTVLWTDPEKGKQVRSPLFVMPVRLSLRSRGKPPLLVPDLSTGGTMVNQCLLQKLADTFRLDASEVASWRGDREDSDLQHGLQAMRAALARDRVPASVEEDASLCLLHFGKFRMWKDLQEHWPLFVEQPVVRHFVERAGQAFVDAAERPTREDLESARVHCPIPADASQLEAVVAAARGCSFVLEGPPGTGKSQTIANLIANALSAGKKVLFVAEKRAALDVVKARLDRVGIGAYCLDIHGKACKPQALRDQLLKSLDAQFAADLEAFERRRGDLAQRRDALRNYAQSLHENNAIGLSLWTARQQALAVGDGSFCAAPQQMWSGGDAALQSLLVSMRELPAIAETAGLRAQHPWSLVEATEGDDACLLRVNAAIDGLEASQPISLGPIATLRSWPAVCVVAHAMMAQRGGVRLQSEMAQAPRDVVLDVRARIDAIVAGQRRLDADFHASLWQAGPKALADAIEQAMRSFFLFRGGRVRKALELVAPHCKRDLGAAGAVLEKLREAERLSAQGKELVDRLRGIPSVVIGTDWSPFEPSCLAALVHALEAVDGWVSAQKGTHATELADALASGARMDASAVDAALRRHVALAAFLAAVSATEESIERWLGNRTVSEACADSMAAWTKDATGSRFLELARWMRLRKKLAELDAAGFSPLREETLRCALPPNELAKALERTAALASVEERMRAMGLQRFDGIGHGESVRAFGRLVEEDAAALAQALPTMLLATRPFRPGQRIGRVGELVRKELMRTRGGLSIRGLMEEHADAILALTPCVLASPDSTAQFLAPGGITFDLVVFDEASQIPVADAIGAIGRGKAVVVVGDSKQMPPTAFFERGGAADADAEEADISDEAQDMESILSEAVASGLQRIWLSWHYRSQDESLIAFSNRHYYESRLASFPAPIANGTGKGVSWLKVDNAEFDSGGLRTNQKEAEALVQEVTRRLRDPLEQKRSMGIVTMNLQQAELVRDMLEQRAESDPLLQRALDDESDQRMFVKNLENVQGDERDVILISLTYAKSRDGKLLMNFGPLSQVGGERRWNVLVTRARQQVVVLSSMEPSDIRLERISAMAKGVQHMRAYMEMAQRGVEKAKDMQLSPMDARDLHRDSIANALRARGLVVETDIGLSSFKVDVAVAHPDESTRRLVAILLDGPGYLARRTVEDREHLPRMVLERLMGWPGVARIWLPEWLLEQERVVDAIAALVAKTRLAVVAAQESQIAAADAVPQQSSVSSQESSPAMPDASASAPTSRDAEDCDFAPYADESIAGSREDLDAPVGSQGWLRVQRVMEEAILAEAPIEGARLAKKVARRFGLSRVQGERVRSLLARIAAPCLDESPFGVFVWKDSQQQAAWRAFRRSPSSGAAARPLAEVAPEEIRNAIVYCAKKGMGLSAEGVLRECAEVFGCGRVSKDERVRIEGVVEWAVVRGELRREGDGGVRVG